MTCSEFQQLLSRGENETLDFKEGGYDLDGGRNKFIKDVLAMANTPREQPAHIIIGVRWTPESGSAVVGLERQLDDAQFQDALGHDRVQPNPRFTYTPLEFQGKQVGVLQVPVENGGPYTPVKDYEGLQAGAVYYRRGTQNDRAVGSELKRIFSWFQNGNIELLGEPGDDAWCRFLEAVHSFESGMTYLLAADRISLTSAAPIHALGLPAWRAVIDFDPDSDTTGLLSCVTGPLERHRVIHRAVRGDYHIPTEPGTYWFFARGLSGRQGTLSLGTHNAWIKSYKQEIAQQLKLLSAAVIPSPVMAILLWSDASTRNYLRTLVEEIYGAFGEVVEIVIVSSDSPSFEALAEDVGATFVRLGLRSLCNGIAVHYADLVNPSEERYVLPGPSGAPVEVESSDWLWLSEDLELVHRSAGLIGDDEAAEFRRGAEITWRDLQLRHDCERDSTSSVRGQIEAELRNRQTVRLSLYHAPGGGGTTLSRRVAWDLHSTIPVAILKKCKPRETAERISKVTALTESSLLLIVDGGQTSERDITDLYEFLKAGQTPVVMLQVLRRFRHPKTTGRRQFWIDGKLTDPEADRFRDAYSKANPARKRELTELASRRNDPHRNAFFFGLTAFGTDFRGLVPHVERRLYGLTTEQKRLLVFIAMAHYYGQQSVPLHAFTGLLGLPRSKHFDLTAVFAGSTISALDLVVEEPSGGCRTAHHLVALEIMQQTMSATGSQERKAVWRQNLSNWGKEFAAFCRGDGHVASDRLLELIRRVFVYRDNTELLGTERAAQRQYAQLIEDIPSRHGKIEVLRYLTECFPLEAHFHAHLGRFLGLNGEFTEAIECVEFAISLQPNDHVLHHMRGMVFRQKMKAEAEAEAKIETLIVTAKEASVSFEEARLQSPDLEHGYISEVQMLIDLIDRAGRGRQDVLRDLLARPESDPFLKHALERAEDLLDSVQNLHAGEDPSRYALDCRARLQRIYGNYQTALQAWDSLLARPEVAKPPVRRQIVWTILGRHGGVWNSLNPKEVNRVQDLLEDNLEEEVNDSTSLRLWLRAIRLLNIPPSLDSIIERVAYWKANTGSLDAAYYLYVLHTLHALAGSLQGAADAERALEECRMLARFRRDRTRSFEWIGAGDGIAALVHQSRLGEWEGDFWESTDALIRISGRIRSIDRAQKGSIELPGGVGAFFVPARGGFHIGKDENAAVTCYVGFSYDGPQAWDVIAKGD